MRLMHPSPGEAYDRMTILNLKVMAADSKGMQGAKTTFELELQAIALYMQDKHWIVPTELAAEMATINLRLWKLEDAQRVLIKEIPPIANYDDISFNEVTFLENAKMVLELNDARAASVQKINAACNVDQVEKIYDSK